MQNITEMIESWGRPSADIIGPEDRIDDIIFNRETQLRAILANGPKREGDIFIIEGFGDKME